MNETHTVKEFETTLITNEHDFRYLRNIIKEAGYPMHYSLESHSYTRATGVCLFKGKFWIAGTEWPSAIDVSYNNFLSKLKIYKTITVW